MHFLQNLGFVMNLKKSFLEPSQTMEFLEVLIELIKMHIFLPQKRKVDYHMERNL